MADPSKISITFDENNQIRVLEQGQFNDSLALQTECYEFINKMKKFEDMVGGLVEVLDDQANKIEAQKLRAVGVKNQVDGEKEARAKKQQELHTLIAERMAELERYTYQYESLVKVEAEQKQKIDKLRNNEI